MSINFRNVMEGNSDHVKNLGEIKEEFKSDLEITDLELEVKIEITPENHNIKTELFKEENNFESVQITGEKRKNKELSNLENKKIKEEFLLFQELDDKHETTQESQEIKEINLEDLNNQVTAEKQFIFSLMYTGIKI